MDTEVDSSTYQNAWRGWAALGQHTASQVLKSEAYAAYFKHLADTLVLNDGDSDGGIPVIDAEPDDHDQSWVTNYLGYMCMDKLIATAGLASRHGSPGGDLRVTVTPMPSYSPSLQFELHEPSHVMVEVYDVRGRSVMSRNVGLLGVGFHSIPLRIGVADEYSAGLYFYVLDSGRKVANGKIVVLR
jgi:hypothetical protein